MSGNKGPTNPVLHGLIRRLRKLAKETGSEIWSDLAERLSRSNRKRAEVNISQLNRHTHDGDIVVVPGKVLGSGTLSHPLTASAFSFSSRARSRIRSEGGETLTIGELLDKNPEGKNVTIVE